MFKWISALFSEPEKTYVGLTQLRERKMPIKTSQKPPKEKNLKISDLMRGIH
ncbi:MAG: hypothetical protein WC197_01605 [Candidatus Gastranaerophilaceae bacterium]